MTILSDSTPAVQPETLANDRQWGKMSGPGRWFHRIADDLDRAWAVSRLTSFERIILQYVREQTWGKNAPQDGDVAPCAINLSWLARVTGTDRRRLRAALQALVADALLVEAEPDRYIIGKHVPSWGGDRINPEGLAYAAGVIPENAEGTRQYSHKTKPFIGTKSAQCPSGQKTPNAAPNCPDGVRQIVPMPAPNCPDGCTELSQCPPAPYRNAGASEELETKKTCLEAARGQEIVEARGDEDRTLRRGESKPVPDQVTAPKPISPVLAARAEDDRLKDWVRNYVSRATGEDEVAIDVVQKIDLWLAMGRHRSVIAAWVAEVCDNRLDPKKYKNPPPPHKLARYFDTLFTTLGANQKTPPIPHEWRSEFTTDSGQPALKLVHEDKATRVGNAAKRFAANYVAPRYDSRGVRIG